MHGHQASTVDAKVRLQNFFPQMFELGHRFSPAAAIAKPALLPTS
jgi:hypothetical protein